LSIVAIFAANKSPSWIRHHHTIKVYDLWSKNSSPSEQYLLGNLTS